MIQRLLSMAATALAVLSVSAQRPDTLWYRFDDRFTAPVAVEISAYDTIVFKNALMTLYKPDGQTGTKSVTYREKTPGQFQFTNPGRWLYKPGSMGGDYTDPNNTWAYDRYRESEHFVCFWEKGMTFDPTYILSIGEKCWDVYTRQLGFVVEGASSTDQYKIIMRVYNTSDWVASGSGEDMKVGTFNVSPWAVTSRGGATVAHEIGHTFQYLTNVDCGANNTHGFNYGLGDNGAGGNGFWENCANWMAYKVYPDQQFTDGENLEEYIQKNHLNFMHESTRYPNCFYQDYLCDRFGQDFIGRLWRESIRPEDPVDAIKRLQGLSHDEFSAMMYDCFAHMCTWDLDAWRTRAAHRRGCHGNHLQPVKVDGEDWYQIPSERCPQNYGYNINRLRVPAAGTEVSVRFQGIAGAAGYRSINKSRAGWRYGLVAYTEAGETIYGDMQKDASGTASLQVPEGCTDLWLVVMGCPTQWWHHQWDDDESNDEQWPYRIQTVGTKPHGVMHTYTADDFPADFVPRDTTVVIDARLARDASNYSAVYVQYDTDAISEALGLTTAQLHAIKTGTSQNPRFCGVNKNGTLINNPTTSTSSSTVYGHWFNSSENVCNYDGNALVFAEMTPANYQCKVGQYPGRLTAGKTYVVRQAVVYNGHRAVMEVHLHIF